MHPLENFQRKTIINQVAPSCNSHLGSAVLAVSFLSKGQIIEVDPASSVDGVAILAKSIQFALVQIPLSSLRVSSL